MVIKPLPDPVDLGVWSQYYVTIDDPSSTDGAPTISSRWTEILAHTHNPTAAGRKNGSNSGKPRKLSGKICPRATPG